MIILAFALLANACASKQPRLGYPEEAGVCDKHLYPDPKKMGPDVTGFRRKSIVGTMIPAWEKCVEYWGGLARHNYEAAKDAEWKWWELFFLQIPGYALGSKFPAGSVLGN